MNRLKLFLLVFVLSACSNSVQTPIREGEIPTSNRAVISPGPSPTKMSPPAPASALPAPAVTPEPDIQLTRISEWNYSSGLVEWFSDSSQFAILSQGQLEIFDTKTQKTKWTKSLMPYQADSGLAITPDGMHIAVYSYGYKGGFKIFNAATGDLQAEKPGTGDCFVDYFPGGMLFINNKTLLAGFRAEKTTDDRPLSVVMWNISPLHCIGRKLEIDVKESEPGEVEGLTLSPDANYLVLIATHSYQNVYEGHVTVWDTATYKQVCSLNGTYAAFRPSNGLLAVVDGKEEGLSYFDVIKCQVTQTLNMPLYDSEQQIIFTPDSKYIILGRDRDLEIRNADNATLVSEYSLDKKIDGIKISPNGEFLLLSHLGENGNISFWKIQR